MFQKRWPAIAKFLSKILAATDAVAKAVNCGVTHDGFNQPPAHRCHLLEVSSFD